MRGVLLTLALLGAVVFGAAFVTSFLNPLLVERGAREVIRIEVERRVGEKIESLSAARIVSLGQRALGKTDAELEDAKRELAAGIPRKVAEVVTAMLNADCECRKRMAAAATGAQEARITQLGQVRERLAGLIESAYASVASNLMKEFRVFTGSNAAAFALLWLVTFFRKGAALQLLLPAVVLTGAVALTGGIYIFNQNWLHTIVYSQYLGLAYAGYLGLAAVFLADVVMNRARITTRLVNAWLQVVGSAVQAVPC
ncbi:hypothetical protein [Ramlibacter sp. WS9]|uniref:hypothetical protein n=1 Tax=Ramlibacter sp. WS9 TaxID=1882741 RepID=UPI0011442941|nr:hypothetical protein [Ramlibacter sp. WS9]ROZ69674.1 hypothetical protein EEB15_22515 [Ramlibacter sp. WS9]